MNEVVQGEASESEDEAMGINIKGLLAAEVIGEASESDEDVYEKKNETASDCDVGSIYNNNLLQRRLIENNLSIWRRLNLFVKNIVTAASKQLLLADQLLIKSQTTMQSVLLTLSQAQVNIKEVYEKTDAVFTANFITNINVQLNKNAPLLN